MAYCLSLEHMDLFEANHVKFACLRANTACQGTFTTCKNVWEPNNLYRNLGTSLTLDLFVHNKIWVRAGKSLISIGSSGFILISLLSISTKPPSLFERIAVLLFRRTPLEETKGVSEKCLLQRLWRDEPAKPEWPVLRSAVAGWIPVQRTR